MADVKAAKLAAARKKLKDHQDKKHVKIVSSVESVADSGNYYNSINENEYFQEDVKTDLKISECSTQSIANSNSQTTSASCKMASTTEIQPPLSPISDENQQRHVFHHSHNQITATEILISEKRNLESKVLTLENHIEHLEDSNAQTRLELNVAKESITKLEMELADSKQLVKLLRNELESMKIQLESNKLKEQKHFECKTELEEKLDATTTALIARNTENSSLLSQLSQIQRELEISHLHLQQLTNGRTVTDNDATVDSKIVFDQNKSLQNKITKLEQQVKVVLNEKEKLATHYKHYIQQLNEQVESAMFKNRQQQLQNESLANREASLVDQISQMEVRIQALQNHITVLDKQGRPVVLELSTEDIDELKLHYEANKAQLHLTEEDYKKVKKQLSDSEMKIIELIETLEALRHEQPDIKKLNAANESDRVAAQRAMSQNTKLKEELHGLQDAFVVMSNDKLDLTEKLQAEKFLNRELTIRLSESEEKFKEFQSKLKAKDEEMIRLQEMCSGIEKEKFLNMQEMDRLRHYDATQSAEDNKELVNSEEYIHKLKSEVDSLKQQETADQKQHETADHVINQNSYLGADEISNEANNVLTVTNLDVIQTEEAMLKLQQRFLRTMKEVAELSEEKQTLEHIVLQLQGETETICEYIALYQQQRGILKQREEERVAQMKYLAAERERMQMQLEELQRMITAGNSEDHNSAVQSHPNFQHDRVEKIVSLLSEIKQSHLIDPHKQCSRLENFHPCPWCSGKLINV